MSTAQDKTATLIAALWQKNQPVVEERIATLQQLPSQPAHQQLEEAISAAHKLSGSLGMYGFSKASEVASRIEHSLKHEPGASISPLIKELRQQLTAGN